MMVNSHGAIRNNPGFSLLELMVAISIFAIVSLLTMGGLNNILSTQEHTESNLQRLVRLQMLFTIMSREIQQLSLRDVRDEYGSTIASVTSETSDGIKGLEYTHQGRFTLEDNVSLQRVAYFLEDNKLKKKVWQVLDRVEDSKPVKQIVLNNINEFSFSFYSLSTENIDNNTYSDTSWQDTFEDDSEIQLKAIKVTLKTSDYDEIYRIFKVAR